MTDYATRRRAANAARFVLLAAALVVFLFPFYWILRTSILPTQTIYESISPIPTDFTLAHYQAAIDNGFLNAIVNSLIAGVGTTLLTTVVALFGAYSILRYTYPARQKVAKMVLLTYMFPHVALIVPMYQLAADLGMLGNPVTLVIVHTMLALPFCMWILQSFLSDIPRELEEAALVEGATQFGAFVRITVPQAMPGIIAAGTFAYIMSWGEYMFAYVLLTTESSQTVPVALQQLLGSYAIDWGLLAAACVLSTLPVLALFWLMAKYLGEGIAKGAGVV
ncbi:carbohydrate ABC transporter permease [Halomicroarcula sp. GCM10025324]|uniref:carbohydrate ABC transporter permease n=1 Tax=Haloarcula TaxID=2237 RepID=UPI0023E7F696|nr:carbohydrate ABC transporter permease [Halomicroarcula sp. ZS-22-S1]